MVAEIQGMMVMVVLGWASQEKVVFVRDGCRMVVVDLFWMSHI